MERMTGTPVTFVNVSNRERALEFYCGTLGLSVRSTDAFGDYLDLGGALLRMTAMPDHKPSPLPVLGWNVDDMKATAASVRARGVAFTVYEGMGQDEHGIWTSPDGATKIAWFADPDGNVLSLSQA